MLVVKAKEPLKFSYNGYDFKLKKKEKLLFANDVFALMPKELQKKFEKAHSVLPPLYNGEDLNGKTLFVFAQAAIGDAICMTPALREIKRRYPECTLWVSISGRARPVLENLPYIDKLLPHPAPYKEISKADYMVKAVEMVGTPSFDYLNMVQYFLWLMKLYFAESEIPDIVVDEKIRKELEDEIFTEIRKLSGNKKLLLFHYLASSVHRTLPPKLLKEIENLIEDEYVPVICSLPEEDITVEVALDVYGIKAANLSPLMKNIKYLIAAVSLVDAVITADTATVHIAGALRKPTVLISGAIDPDLRCETYPTVIPVRPNYKGETCTAPCMKHATNEPCGEAKIKKQFYSPCLESIPPKVIYFALKDAELASQQEFPLPEKCPLCDYKGDFPLFEVINQHRIFECPACGLQFAYPLKAMDYENVYKKESDDLLHYSNINYIRASQVSEEKEEIKKWEKLPRFNVLLPILSVLPRGKLLDVGCGFGNFMLIARKRGFEVFGMEASQEAVKIANEKFGLNVVRASKFEELPEDWKGPYKVITAFEVVEHLQDPKSFFQDVYNMLEDKGIFLMSCPMFYSFENLAKGYRKYKWWLPDYPPNHLTRWKPWTLYYALKQTGFSKIFIFTEALIPDSVLEGIDVKEVELKRENQRIIVPKNAVYLIILNHLNHLYLNARYLGKFLFALAIKKDENYNWEYIIKKAIKYSAVELVWKRGEQR